MIDARYAELIANGRECRNLWANIMEHVTTRVTKLAPIFHVRVDQHEEVISKSIGAVFSNIGSYDPMKPGANWVHKQPHPRSFEFWVNGIVANQLKDAGRSDGRWTRLRGVSLGPVQGGSEESYEVDPPSPADSPELEVTRRQYWQAAFENELNFRELWVIELVFQMGYTYAEAAEQIGTTANAVGCIVHDIRRKLRPSLDGWLNA